MENVATKGFYITSCLDLLLDDHNSHYKECMAAGVSRSVINVSGNKSAVLSSKGFEKAILEIPHQVHDVVSKTRGTEGYHGRIRTSKCGHEG